jgi:hypothetical protein
MKLTFRSPFAFKSVLSIAVLSLASLNAYSQATPQITRNISDSELSTLHGNVHPLAKPAYDKGAVSADIATGRLILSLKRSPSQEAALQQFLSDIHTKGSSSYHKWLTPSDFGKRFGLADSDLTQVQSWLQSQGFTVDKVSAGRTSIEFSGTAGQISTAFHTSLHTYVVNGETHHSNATDPQIPAALAPVIAGVTRLNDFHPKPQSHFLGRAKYDATARKVKPEWTIGSGNDTAYTVGPADLATQYNLTPLHKAGISGAGQIIGIINDSNIDLGTVQSYRKLFNLDTYPTKPNLPRIIIDGNDPGVNSDSIEAYLDVEMAGAVAPQATVNLYIGANTDFDDGLDLAILRAVEDDSATVLSLSFGNCEAGAGASYLAFINSVWEQAAAQGQTVMVSTGDSGSAGCDNENESISANSGLQVNGLASTPWNIGVGGTDFYYSDYATGGAGIAQDWSATNDPNLGSLLHPLPEQPWNDSSYGLNLYYAAVNSIGGGGGGQSTCAVINGPLTGQNPLVAAQQLCIGLGGVPKPAWQSGPGVPADGVRDLPDISLFAANGSNNSFHAICAEPGDCIDADPESGTLYYTGIGGTSAAAPAFAGIMSLVNQKYGAQGQANTILYPLAAQMPSVFHDVTVGSNNVPCNQSGPNCTKDANANSYSLQNWPATAGYDLASGLGSVDANALLTNWNSVKFTGTSLALSVSPATITHGSTVNITTNAIASSGSAIPTGSVAIIADTLLPANKGQLDIPLDSTGAGAASVNYLPGGTYTIQGNYSGDTTFSASQSAPITVMVSPESSVLLASAFEYQTAPFSPQYPLEATVPYGMIVGIDAQVANTSGVVDGVATGVVTVQDNGAAIAMLPLNATGATVYSTGIWTIGNHSITMSYAGDLSYSATTATLPKAPITFTVSKGAPSISLVANSSNLPIGGTYIVQIIVNGGTLSTAGASPTGNITVTFGGTTQTVPLVPTYLSSSSASATFPNLTAGTYPVSFAYAGDGNWSATSVTGNPVIVASSTLLPSTTSVTGNPVDLSTLVSGTLVTLTATVTGSGAAPTGSVYFVTDGQTFSNSQGAAFPLLPGSGNTSTATLSFAAGNSYGGTNQVYVLYLGDDTYNLSSSPVLMFNNNQGDFAILNKTPTISISSGAAGTASLTLSANNQFSGKVTLACAVTGPGTILPVCTVPTSVTLPSTGQVPVTVQLATTLSMVSEQRVEPTSRSWMLRGSSATALACLLFWVMPSRRRRLQALVALVIVMSFVSAITGCSNGNRTPPVTSSPAVVSAGMYQAVITATNGVITHNVLVNIQVTSVIEK